MTIAPKRRFVDLSTDAGFFALLTDSYARLVGVPLVPPAKDADWLYREAPFVVVAHGTDQDPKFIYANKAAQKCFEYSWEEFMSLPSRLSAEAPDWAQRQALLEKLLAMASCRAIGGFALPSPAGALSSRTGSSGSSATGTV